MQLPIYQQNRQVRAGKITAIINRDGNFTNIYFDGGFITVANEFIYEHNPHIDGYLVIDEEGQMSFVSELVFNNGHKPIES